MLALFFLDHFLTSDQLSHNGFMVVVHLFL